MMTYVWLFTISVCFLNCSRQNKCLRKLEILSMTFLMSCNNIAADEANLYQDYNKFFVNEHKLYDFTSYLFSEVLEKPFGEIGISFGWFNFITIFIAWLMINRALSKIECNASVIYLLYSVSSILLDTTLYRQFLAFPFVLFAFCEILNGKISKKKYIIYVLIATSIHFSMIVYLSFLIFQTNKKYLKWHYTLCGLLYLGINCLLGSNRFVLLRMIFSVIGGVRFSYYSGQSAVQLGWMFSFVIWAMMVTLSKCILRVSKGRVDEEIYERIKIIDYFMMVSVFFVSFTMMTMIYSRMLRPISWLVFIEIAFWYSGCKNKTSIARLRVNMVTVVATCFIAVYSLIFNHIIFEYDYCNKPVLSGIPFWDEDYSKMYTQKM